MVLQYFGPGSDYAWYSLSMPQAPQLKLILLESWCADIEQFHIWLKRLHNKAKAVFFIILAASIKSTRSVRFTHASKTWEIKKHQNFCYKKTLNFNYSVETRSNKFLMTKIKEYNKTLKFWKQRKFHFVTCSSLHLSHILRTVVIVVGRS